MDAELHRLMEALVEMDGGAPSAPARPRRPGEKMVFGRVVKTASHKPPAGVSRFRRGSIKWFKTRKPQKKGKEAYRMNRPRTGAEE